MLGDFGIVPLITYGRTKSIGLETTVANINSTRPISHNIVPTTYDLMWSCTRNIPGWNNFMKKATTGKSFAVINASSSDYDTIYTAFLSAVEKSWAINQNTWFVTFDLPWEDHVWSRVLKGSHIKSSSRGEENYGFNRVHWPWTWWNESHCWQHRKVCHSHCRRECRHIRRLRQIW